MKTEINEEALTKEGKLFNSPIINLKVARDQRLTVHRICLVWRLENKIK